MIRDIFNWLSTRKREKNLKKHYHVMWDNALVTVKSRAFNQSNVLIETFKWNDIERVCLEITEKNFSDELYIFTSCRLEAFIIPLEAKNGQEFMTILLAKRLFDNQYINSKKYRQVGQYWWPESAA